MPVTSMTERARPGRPAAAAAVARPLLRETAASRRGAIRAALVAAAAGALWLYGARGIAAAGIALAAFLLAAALLWPRANLMLERAALWLARRLGRVVTAILMAAVFYLFITPFGRSRRRGDRDRLRRRLERERDSYWELREGDTVASDSLERQY